MTNLFSVMFRTDTEGINGLLDSSETHLLHIYGRLFYIQSQDSVKSTAMTWQHVRGDALFLQALPSF